MKGQLLNKVIGNTKGQIPNLKGHAILIDLIYWKSLFHSPST